MKIFITTLNNSHKARKNMMQSVAMLTTPAHGSATSSNSILDVTYMYVLISVVTVMVIILMFLMFLAFRHCQYTQMMEIIALSEYEDEAKTHYNEITNDNPNINSSVALSIE